MRLHAEGVLFAAILLAISVTTVSAEPITAFYNVEVVELSNGTTTTAINDQFSLTVTFDPANPASNVFTYPYGSVTVSPIPLGPLPPAGLDVFIDGSSTYAVHYGLTVEPPSRYGYVAGVAPREFGSAVIDGQPTHFYREVRLENAITTLNSPAVISPDTFPEHLSLNPASPFPFNFHFTVCLDVGLLPAGFTCTGTAADSELAIYSGRATLTGVEPSNPTPEPATLVLVGGGLLWLGRHLRRSDGIRFKSE